MIGNPKSDFELSNNSNNGTFKANNISSERITSFCSCLFFIRRCSLLWSEMCFVFLKTLHLNLYSKFNKKIASAITTETIYY